MRTSEQCGTNKYLGGRTACNVDPVSMSSTCGISKVASAGELSSRRGHKAVACIPPNCQAIYPGTGDGGGITGPGPAQVPNPDLRISINMRFGDRFRFSGLGFRGGPGIEILPAPLTPTGAWGAGEDEGYPGPTCPRDPMDRVGLFWPFRDGAEVAPGPLACMAANAFPIMPASAGFEDFVLNDWTGIARGGPTETDPAFPMDVSRLNRGFFDPEGNVGLGGIIINTLDGEQRLIKVEVVGGEKDVVRFNPVTNRFYRLDHVGLLPSSAYVVIPGVVRLPEGAAIDGVAAIDLGEYPRDPVTVQNTQTSAGDEVTDDDAMAPSSGSELDALYARVRTPGDECRVVTEPTVRLFFAGNLASNGTNLEIFIDSLPGKGQHTLLGNNFNGAGGALNRMGEKQSGNGNTEPGPAGRGLTFENGCAPDFYTNISLLPGTRPNDYNLYVWHATLPTAGHGVGWFAGSINDDNFQHPGNGMLSGADGGAPLIRASISNLNFQGVRGGSGTAPGDGPTSGADVITGVEVEIPLSAIGNPRGPFRVVAFINGSDHGLVSNQVLPGINGGGALGEPRAVDFSVIPGSQCATIYPKNILWPNGDFDEANPGAQVSQVGLDQNWEDFARITADDFYLCDGQVHSIDTVTGTLLTDSRVPKATVVIWPDCDGRPDINHPIAVLSSAPQVFEGRPIPSVDGEVVIRETGDRIDGLRRINVEAHFTKPIFLRGGEYWVSLIGFSGTGDTAEQFYWGTTGAAPVKGRPGQFYDSDVGGWVDIDLLCCGCVDFNFCIGGYSCKLLLDNASPLGAGPGEFPATPSLQNGTRTSDKSRSASDVAAPPCLSEEVCYVEGYIWTNCERANLEFYGDDCNRPSAGALLGGPYPADCMTDTGVRAAAPGTGAVLRLYKAVFYTFTPLLPLPGRNFWVGIYALGDNAQSARGYLALGDRCDRPCDRLWAPPFVRGPAFESSLWRAAAGGLSLHDHAVAVAVRGTASGTPASPAASAGCPSDINRDGASTVEDVFEFLRAWFAGCP